VASETCALDIVGATAVREIEPGELVVLDGQGARVRQAVPRGTSAPRSASSSTSTSRVPTRRSTGSACTAPAGGWACAWRPRRRSTRTSSSPSPTRARPAAQGYARATGLPYADGLVKNRYVGRTFIQPDQRLREHAVQMKFNPLPDVVDGQRVVMVDDSIVRGSTTRKLVALLKHAGAAEVHVRISSRPSSRPATTGSIWPPAAS
jgi:amidophosphoribosyltransferase